MVSAPSSPALSLWEKELSLAIKYWREFNILSFEERARERIIFDVI
jgi:hypothetical protein